MVSVEGEGHAESLVGDLVMDQRANSDQRAFHGEGSSVHAFFATDAEAIERLALRLQTGEGQSLRVRVLEVFRGAKLTILRRLKRFGRCRLCKEIMKALINAILAFLGVPPGVSVPIDLDEVGDLIRQGAEALHERLPGPLKEIVDQLLGDQGGLELIAKLLQAALAALDFRNLAASRARKALGYCR